MRARRLTSVLAGPVLAALILAGCGDSGTGTDQPTVSEIGGVNASATVGSDPAVDFDGELAVETTERKVLTEGNGTEVKPGQRLVINYVAVDGTTKRVFESSFADKRPATFVLSQDIALPGLLKALEGAKVGSRVMATVAPSDAYQAESAQTPEGVDPASSVIFVIDVISATDIPTRASGTPVTPEPGLPTVTLAANGEPTITLPSGDAPDELVVQPLIKGTGSKVAMGQTLRVHYKGVIWPGGEEFDSSWKPRQEGAAVEPSEFPLVEGGLISGWLKGLPGQTVGSQVMLVVPPAEGYGAEGNPQGGIEGTDTLVFVVDILDAS